MNIEPALSQTNPKIGFPSPLSAWEIVLKRAIHGWFFCNLGLSLLVILLLAPFCLVDPTCTPGLLLESILFLELILIFASVGLLAWMPFLLVYLPLTGFLRGKLGGWEKTQS